MALPGLARFRPIPLQLGDEEALLHRALAAVHELPRHAVAVLPEFVAWTPVGSGNAFGALADAARAHDVTIITTLNLHAELAEDLPGHDDDARYNALAIFTRHGDVHVPQAKVTPQSFEMSTALDGPAIAVTPYSRVNRVRLDTGDGILDAVFFICSDLWILTRIAPALLRADLYVVPANFARGAEQEARKILDAVRAGGVARATVLVNAWHESRDARPPLALAVSEILEGTEESPAEPLDPSTIHDRFRVLDDADAPGFAAMVESPVRAGRIAVPRSRTSAPVEAGVYPITISI